MLYNLFSLFPTISLFAITFLISMAKCMENNWYNGTIWMLIAVAIAFERVVRIAKNNDKPRY